MSAPGSFGLLAAGLLLAGMLCPAGVAAARQEPAPGDVLRGPRVAGGKVRTLVSHTMRGELVLVEGRPELAALALLELPAEARARAIEVAERRRDALTDLLVDELDAIRAMTDDIDAGRADAARRRLAALWERHDADRSAAPLVEPLAAVLDSADAEELARLVDEYLAAVVRREVGAEADAGAVASARRRLAFELFHAEIREVYAETLGRTRASIEAIVAAVEQTPAQREAIRDLVVEHVRATRFEATPDERRRVMRRIYDALDEERRGRLFDLMVRQILPAE